jgi:hypothetical protein
MVESDIVLLYIWSRVCRIISTVGPSVATIQTPRSLFPVMAPKGPRYSHRRGVGGIVNARDSHVKAS